MTQPCRVSRWIETYVDGELSAERVVEVEAHLLECGACRERRDFEQALRRSLRRQVRQAALVSTDFEKRIRQRLVAHRNAPPEPLPAHRRNVPSGALTWRSVVPLSIAAGVALVGGALKDRDAAADASGHRFASTKPAAIEKSDTMASVREFLDELAVHYSQPSTSVIHASSQLPVIGPEPGWAIQPPEFRSLGGVWEGWEQRRTGPGRVASLHYRFGGHRVVVWVYDSQRLPLRAVLEPHVARNRPVFVGMHRGFSVAAVEDHGLGYAATTDLPTAEAAELVAAAVH